MWTGEPGMIEFASSFYLLVEKATGGPGQINNLVCLREHAEELCVCVPMNEQTTLHSGENTQRASHLVV